MIVLGIESSGEWGGAAVVDGDKVLRQLTEDLRMSHAAKLLKLIDSVLSASAVAHTELQAVGVSIGPGSFTGLRIGLATAKGLALALGLPLGPVPTLDAIAFAARTSDQLVLAAMDARRQEIYGRFYRHSMGTVIWKSPSVVCPGIELGREAIRLLKPGENLVVTGTGSRLVAKEFPETLRARIRLSEHEPQNPLPSSVARLAREYLLRGSELDSLEPLYLRKSDAESKRERARE
jgi:tRNA threonylcarbamoyladenosine biosynthesis protein TsaB